MLLSPRWRKVFRDLWSNKSRTILVVLSITIGVSAFGGLFTARSLILTSLDREFQATNSSDINMTIPNIDDLLVQYMLRQPYVTGVQTYTSHRAEILINGEVTNAELIAFEDMNDIRLNIVNHEAGVYPPSDNEVVLERSFLDELDIQIGDNLTIRTFDDKLHEFRLVGTVHSLAIRPGTLITPVWMTPRALFNMGLSTEENQMELTVIRQGDPGTFSIPPLQEIATQIREDLRDNSVNILSLEVKEDTTFWATDILAAVIAVLVIIGMSSLFLSAFLVVNTISGIMAAQKKQIGIMKIIGADRTQIIIIYLVMVTILGLMAFVIAVPISISLAEGILSFIGNFLNYNTPEIFIPYNIIIIELVIAILVPVLSALMPVLSGTAITPAEAITDFVGASGTNPVDNLLVKLGGLYRPILISVRNTFRKKTRLAITLFTLTFAGTLFISVMNVRDGLLVNITELLNMSQFDIQMSFGQQYQVDGLERRILSSPYISSVESWIATSIVRKRPNFTESQNYTLLGMYPDSVFVSPKMTAGQWLPPYSNESRFNVVIPPDLLKAEPDLYVGGTLRLKLGDKEQDWTIVGVLETNQLKVNDIYAYYDAVATFSNAPNLTNRVLIDVVDSVDPFDLATLADQLTIHLEDRNFDVVGVFVNTDIITTITEGFTALVTLLLGMAILVALVAGLGLTGTMSLNVLERTREIGVMRAVGAGSMIIRLMFVGEGMIIGVLSFIIALPLSIFGTIAFSNLMGIVLFGKPLPIILTPVGVFVWLAIVLTVSSVASIIPANRASQISIREAISYE